MSAKPTLADPHDAGRPSAVREEARQHIEEHALGEAARIARLSRVRELVLGFQDGLLVPLGVVYVATYEAGFRKDGKRVVSQRYVISTSGASTDERADGIYARADVTGASWFTFMTYSIAWWNLSEAARAGVRDSVPIDRTPGEEPTDGNGYWENGRNYASCGTSTSRSGFRPT